MEYALIFVVAVALAFDYVNGFHDAANSIATVVSTRVLTPRIAVMWAAFFNFAAFLVFGDHVAATIANDVVEQNVLSIGVVFAGLVGAIAWDLITFYLGLPTSSSHALVGGMAGAAVAKAGFDVLVANGLRTIGVFIVLSPLIGLALGLIVTLVIFWTFRRNRDVSRLNRGFRHGQLASAAAFSLGHGANDAQKTMGVILALLIATGHASSGASTPLWVVLAAHTAIALGTLTGGWRIVRRWALASPSCSRPAAWPLSRRPRSRCSPRRPGGSRCRPRTRSPVALWASGPPAGCRRCAGA
jgi:inorganic phosphate transporter, PiT family